MAALCPGGEVMKDQLELAAEERSIVGKKVKSLRRQGVVPAVVYGHDAKSVPVQVKRDELAQLIKHGGRTSVLKLKVGRHRAVSVTIKQLHTHPLSGDLLHADFYRVAANEKLKMRVPVLFSGEAPVMRMHEAALIKALTDLEVECLPADLPNHVVADLTRLADIGDALRIADLEPIDKVTFLGHPDDVVVSVAAAAKEAEVAEQAAEVEEAPEAEAAAAQPSGGGEEEGESSKGAA